MTEEKAARMRADLKARLDYIDTIIRVLNVEDADPYRKGFISAMHHEREALKLALYY
jgi:hypothetical protein